MDTETAYENLANAIVLQAVKDYRAAKRCRNGGSIGVIRKFSAPIGFGRLRILTVNG